MFLERNRMQILGEVAWRKTGRGKLADFQQALRHQPLWNMPAWFDDCPADAYLKLGRLDEAIAEYQRAVRMFPGVGPSHYHLGVAYQRKGQRDLAKTAYRRFLKLWNQADPDVPEVVAARAELAR
jgi:tetratricopeptide (TPR) repeat protein